MFNLMLFDLVDKHILNGLRNFFLFKQVEINILLLNRLRIYFGDGNWNKF